MQPGAFCVTDIPPLRIIQRSFRLLREDDRVAREELPEDREFLVLRSSLLERSEDSVLPRGEEDDEGVDRVDFRGVVRDADDTAFRADLELDEGAVDVLVERVLVVLLLVTDRCEVPSAGAALLRETLDDRLPGAERLRLLVVDPTLDERVEPLPVVDLLRVVVPGTRAERAVVRVVRVVVVVRGGTGVRVFPVLLIRVSL